MGFGSYIYITKNYHQRFVKQKNTDYLNIRKQLRKTRILVKEILSNCPMEKAL